MNTRILFICLHGSAKSLIAAEYLNRRARARGLVLRAESAGIEPETEIPPAVVAGLASDGFDVSTYTPRGVTSDLVDSSARVVAFGCDPAEVIGMSVPVERWDDMPMVTDGYEQARDAIIARVDRLLDAFG